MVDKIGVKVALRNWHLTGSSSSNELQRVATVYIDGAEYRVSAPPEAKGDALEWVPHFTVRSLIDACAEGDVQDAMRALALRVVKEELENRKQNAHSTEGMHPDGTHCAAQICRSGHVIHCDGMSFESKTHCTKCGAPCIDRCQRCSEPIRGVEKYQSVAAYPRPQFCHKCGAPYPWMEDILNTARQLLHHDDKLTQEDRISLWGDLQYVMSDPRGTHVPARKKLIEFNLKKATETVREAILDLMAKTAAEMTKG